MSYSLRNLLVKLEAEMAIIGYARVSTQADYCRHMAEESDGAFDEPWVLLAAAWTELAQETKARSRGSRPS